LTRTRDSDKVAALAGDGTSGWFCAFPAEICLRTLTHGPWYFPAISTRTGICRRCLRVFNNVERSIYTSNSEQRSLFSAHDHWTRCRPVLCRSCSPSPRRDQLSLRRYVFFCSVASVVEDLLAMACSWDDVDFRLRSVEFHWTEGADSVSGMWTSCDVQETDQEDGYAALCLVLCADHVVQFEAR